MKLSNFILPGLLFCLLLHSLPVHAQDTKTPKGAYLKAKIDGIDWSADTFIFDKYVSEIVQIWGSKGNTELLVQLTKPVQNKIMQLIKTDLNHWTDAKFNMYMVQDGEIQVTKMDDQWIEGIFHCNAQDGRSLKKVVITAGTFRIPNPKSFKN